MTDFRAICRERARSPEQEGSVFLDGSNGSEDSDRDEGPLYFGYPASGIFQDRENTPDEKYVDAMDRFERTRLMTPTKRKPEISETVDESPTKQSRIAEKLGFLKVIWV